MSFNNVSSEQSSRPRPLAMLNDNTTVTGSWLKGSDMEATSREYERMINNVSLVFPHAGLFAAARLQQNEIPQAQDVDVGTKWLFLKPC